MTDPEFDTTRCGICGGAFVAREPFDSFEEQAEVVKSDDPDHTHLLVHAACYIERQADYDLA